MPFIIPIVLAVAAVVTSTTFIVSMVVSVALSLGLSYLAKSMQKAPGTQPGVLGGVQTAVQFGSDLPRSAIFGEQATAGHLVYWNTFGVNNECLELVYAVGDGLHDSLAAMFVNGLPVTIAPTATTTTYPSGEVITGHIVSEFVDAANGYPYMFVRFFDGGDSQAADNELVIHANPAGRWTADDTLTGVSYVSVTVTYNPVDLFSTGIPQFLFVTKGLRCYDPRKDSTNGGSGAHRWGTQSTYEWTANSAVCLYNYQRGIYINGNLVLGQGLAAADMINDAYVAAANACDEDITLVLGAASIASIFNGGSGYAVGDVITLTGGTFTVSIKVRVDTVASGVITVATVIQSGHFTVAASDPVAQGSTTGAGTGASFDLTWTSTEKRYRVGMQVSADVQHRDSITAFLSSMAGALLEDAGSFAPLAGVSQTVALSFTDGDLIAGQPQKYSSHRSRADLINAVFGTYSEPTQNWASISSPPRTSSADETEDGERLAVSIDFSMIYSGTQAQRVEEITRKLARLQATGTVVLPFKFCVLEPGDWVTWTSARFGFTKTFLILATIVNADQTIVLTLRETAATAFAWTPATDELSGTAPTNLAGFNDLATTVDAFSIAAVQINASGGLTIPAIQCNWTAVTDPTITAVLVQYRIQGDTNILQQQFDSPGDGTGLISSGIQGGTIYEAQATIITQPVRATTWTTWVPTASAVGNQVVSTSAGVVAGGVDSTALDSAINATLTQVNGSSATVTITIASPAVVTWAAHGLLVGSSVKFATTGALPTGITAGTYYYVLATGLTTNTFEISATLNGAAINTSGSQSGTQTGTANGLATTYADVVSLQSITNDPTSGNSALAVRATNLEAALTGPSVTVTITIASPCVITWAAHGLIAGSGIKFATTGALPTGITAGTTYYVISAGLTTNAFEIAASVGGTAINTSGSQSGTQTASAVGLSATYSDVIALQTLTNDPTHGNLALAIRETNLAATINGSSATVTITIASPAVVTWTAHGFSAGQAVKFTTTGALPTGIVSGTYYYIISTSLTTNTFRISATAGGSAINTSGSQSGVHTGTAQSISATYSDVVILQSVTNNSTSGNSALSTRITTNTAAIGDVSANGTFQTIASAGSGGALSLIDMQVSASVGATFANAGIQMAAFVDASSNPYSRLRLYSSQTEFGVPGQTGGGYFAPFGINTVNGALQVSLVPNAIPDGAIGPRALAAGVAGGNISILNSSDVARTLTAWYNSGAGEVVLSSQVVVGDGNALRIDFDTTLNSSGGSFSGGSTAQATVVFQVDINGTVLKSFTVGVWTHVNSTPDTYFHNTPVSFSLIAPGLAAGLATITVKILPVTGDSITLTAIAPAITLQEYVKPTVVVNTATAPTASVTYVASTYGGTSGTFSGASIGTANVNRVVVVGVGFYSTSNSIPTLTIGGVSANLIGYNNAASAGYRVALFELSVPSGTTATIIADPQCTFANMEISVWRVIAFSQAPIECFCGDSTAAGNSSTLTFNSISTNDVLVMFCYGDPAITGYSGAWGGTDTPTENVDALTSGSGARYSNYNMAMTQVIKTTFAVTAAGGTHMFAMVGATWK